MLDNKYTYPKLYKRLFVKDETPFKETCSICI